MPNLTQESIERAAPGSEIVLDTLDRAAFTKGKDTPMGRKVFRSTEPLESHGS